MKIVEKNTNDEDKDQDYFTVDIPIQLIEDFKSMTDDIFQFLSKKYLREGAVTIDDLKDQFNKHQFPYNEIMVTKIYEEIVTPSLKKLDVLRGMVNCECPFCHHKYVIHVDKDEIY